VSAVEPRMVSMIGGPFDGLKLYERHGRRVTAPIVDVLKADQVVGAYELVTDDTGERYEYRLYPTRV